MPVRRRAHHVQRSRPGAGGHTLECRARMHDDCPFCDAAHCGAIDLHVDIEAAEVDDVRRYKISASSNRRSSSTLSVSCSCNSASMACAR